MRILPPPAARRKKIAFIKRGLFSYSNQRTAEQIQLLFPEYELEEIDAERDLLAGRPVMFLRNLASIWQRYSSDLLARRRTVQDCFFRTPFIFEQMQQLVRARLAPLRSEYAFSLQTQSLYDASVPGLPHFVYTDHTHLTNLSYPGFQRRELFSRDWIDLEQTIYRNADHVFVMSEHVRQSLINQYGCPPERASCVYAGSNIDATPIPLENGGFENQTIVFVGVDWVRKGGPTLLKAFDLVLQSLPEARLIIVGASPKVTHPHIEVIGRCSREEVKRQMVRGSVFCLPTQVEPFGIAVVEAFFQGLPAVASRIGALADLVRDDESGKLVEPGDETGLAAALVELLSNPDKCREFGKAGRATVTERYSWPAVGRRLQGVIEQTLAERKRVTVAA